MLSAITFIAALGDNDFRDMVAEAIADTNKNKCPEWPTSADPQEALQDQNRLLKRTLERRKTKLVKAQEQSEKDRQDLIDAQKEIARLKAQFVETSHDSGDGDFPK